MTVRRQLSNPGVMLRTYELLWKTLKESPDKPLVVQCHRPDIAARVRRGMIKEKHRDVGFKVVNELEYFWLDITYDNNKHQLTFILRKRYDLQKVVS